MGGIMNSKQKGKRGERQWRDQLREAGFSSARRGQQFQGTPESPDVECSELPKLHFEVKLVERLNVWDAMNQAIDDAGVELTPILAHKRNRSDWLVTMRAEDWFELIRESKYVSRAEGVE